MMSRRAEVGRFGIATALAAVALGLAGCSLGPVWKRPIEGRLIDAHSGDPIAGAWVEATYRAFVIGPHGTSPPIHTERTRTDAEGIFRFEGGFLIHFMVGASSDFKPDIEVFHPAYGNTSWNFHRGYTNEITPKEDFLDRLLKSPDPEDVCPHDVRGLCGQKLRG